MKPRSGGRRRPRHRGRATLRVNPDVPAATTIWGWRAERDPGALRDAFANAPASSTVHRGGLPGQGPASVRPTSRACPDARCSQACPRARPIHDPRRTRQPNWSSCGAVAESFCLCLRERWRHRPLVFTGRIDEPPVLIPQPGGLRLQVLRFGGTEFGRLELALDVAPQCKTISASRWYGTAAPIWLGRRAYASTSRLQ
jgi:hypothetical protein